MRVLILWSRISGYMAACWDRFAEMEGVELRVVAWASSQMDDSVFDSTVTATANCHLLSPDEREDRAIVESEIRSFQPDVIVVPGWLSAAYRSCIEALPSKRPLVVMGMDTPWNGRLRQHFTRWRYRKLFANVDRVVVAGERTWQYARRLGFLEQQISRGVYGWDESSFTQNKAVVAADPSFVFVGRLAEEKGIRSLLSAYQNYQDEVKVPWRLTICGTGPLQSLIDAEHVEYLGFVQPRDLPGVLRQSSVMVLPSSYEPWGVALAEAMGSGLPVIATEACGAAVDLIRPFWNGLLVPTNSVSALQESFLWFHSNRNRVSEMGQNARKAAEPFSASNWAVRWFEMLTRLVGRNATVTARRAA